MVPRRYSRDAVAEPNSAWFHHGSRGRLLSMQLHLRTLVIALAVAPPALKWLWDVRAEWLPFLSVVLPVALFSILAAIYTLTLAADADAEKR
jgi:hypothetical protein